MENILNELFYGNIAPFEWEIPRSAEFKKAMADEMEAENRLYDIMDEKTKELYNEYSSCVGERRLLESAHYFEEAFKLGMRIMLTCFV